MIGGSLRSSNHKRPGPSAEQRGGQVVAWRAARRVDDALACGREHSILGGAAYRSRARKPLWPCVGAALAPVTCLCVLISLRKMRCERAKMAIFLWLAPRPALAGSYLLWGEAPEKSAILNAAKIGVLTRCTRFCYTYWEHQCARRQEPPGVHGCGWDSGAARKRSSALAASVASRYALGADGVGAARPCAPVAARSLPRATRSAPKAGALRARAPTCTCAPCVLRTRCLLGVGGDVEDVVRCALLERLGARRASNSCRGRGWGSTPRELQCRRLRHS